MDASKGGNYYNKIPRADKYSIVLSPLGGSFKESIDILDKTILVWFGLMGFMAYQPL